MSVSHPTVSVVLPTYNREDVVDRSIGSVLGQSYNDFELIIVDDASSDGTKEVIESYEDSRVEYVRHDENRGAAAARNTGIQTARGEIIAFQDSDDVWKPTKLERQVKALDRAETTVGVVYTGTWRVSDDSRSQVPGPRVEPKEGDIRKPLFKRNFVTPQATAVRAECFETVGTFDEDLPPLEDWEFWLRVAEDYEFHYIDEPLVTAYYRADSISRNEEQKVRAREKIIRKHRDRFPRDKLANQLFWIGHGYLKVGRPATGRKYLIEAARTQLRPAYLGAVFLSLFGSELYRGFYRQYKTVS